MPNVLDRAIALFAILSLSPVFLLVIVLMKICDPGPIFYVAKRSGLDGIVFDMYKFRSMRVRNVSEGHGPSITARMDARITSIGKILRMTKIDELPQLLNILKGDMAVIGPRPEDPNIVQCFYDKNMMQSLSVRPGLASPGSIYNFTHIEDNLPETDPTLVYTKTVLKKKVLMDSYYAERKSFLYDLIIILRTLAVVFMKVFGWKIFSDPPELAKINSVKSGVL